MRRVLHLRSSSAIYGPETHILQLMEPLQQHGFQLEPLVFYRRGKHAVPIHPLVEEVRRRGRKADQLVDSAKVSPQFVLQVVEKLRNDDFHLIHTHDYKANVLGAMAAGLAKIPCVATVHLYGLSTCQLRLYRLLDLVVLRFFSKVITVSHDLREELVTAGLPHGRVVTIHNAIELCHPASYHGLEDRQRMKKQLGIDCSVPIVTIVGRLNPQKGHRYFLKSARQILEVLPETRFLIIGDGGLRKHLEELSASLGVKQAVSFLGYRKDVAAFMALSDVVVIPSLREGLPYVLLEALAMARPVVATPVGGVPELVTHGQTGLLVPPKDPGKLAEATLFMLRNPRQAARLGEKGREIVARKYSVETMARKTAQLYMQVLSAREQADAL